VHGWPFIGPTYQYRCCSCYWCGGGGGGGGGGSGGSGSGVGGNSGGGMLLFLTIAQKEKQVLVSIGVVSRGSSVPSLTMIMNQIGRRDRVDS